MKQRCHKFPIFLILILFVSFGSLPFSFAKQNVLVKIETNPGLHTVKFETNAGTINVNLPDNIAKGDNISGTMNVEAEGKTEKIRFKNTKKLKKYTLEVEDTRIPVGEESFNMTIPTDMKGGVFNLILKDKKGKEAARADIPVLPTPSSKEGPQSPGPGDFYFPSPVQAGIPFHIEGPFNGKFDNTALTIDEKEAIILAESPRALIIESPGDMVGVKEIKMTEGDIVARGDIRIVSLSLAAPKLHLKRGQTTTLTVTVRGLEGLDEEIPLRLQNMVPDVLRMEGGNAQTFSIHPGDVQPGGTYTMTRILTGITPGQFKIIARLSYAHPQPQPKKRPRKPMILPGWHVKEGPDKSKVLTGKKHTYIPRRDAEWIHVSEGPDKSHYYLLEWHAKEGPDKSKYIAPGKYKHVKTGLQKTYHVPIEWPHVIEGPDKSGYYPPEWHAKEGPDKSLHFNPAMHRHSKTGRQKTYYVPTEWPHVTEGPDKSQYYPPEWHAKEGPDKSLHFNPAFHRHSKTGRQKTYYVPTEWPHVTEGPDKSQYYPPEWHAKEGPDKSLHFNPAMHRHSKTGRQKTYYVPTEWPHVTEGPDKSQYYPPGWHAKEGPDKSKHFDPTKYRHIKTGPSKTYYEPYPWPHVTEGPDKSKHIDLSKYRHVKTGLQKTYHVPIEWPHVIEGPDKSGYYPPEWHAKEGPDKSLHFNPAFHRHSKTGRQKTYYVPTEWPHVTEGPDKSQYYPPEWHAKEGPDQSLYFNPAMHRHSKTGRQKTYYVPTEWPHVTEGPDKSQYYPKEWHATEGPDQSKHFDPAIFRHIKTGEAKSYYVKRDKEAK